MLEYEVLVSRVLKFAKCFAKFEEMATMEHNMIFKYNFSTKKETTPKKMNNVRLKLAWLL